MPNFIITVPSEQEFFRIPLDWNTANIAKDIFVKMEDIHKK